MTSTALFFWFRIALIVLLAGWLTYRIYRRRNTLIDFDKVERQDEILAERRARQEQMVDRATGGRTRTLTEPVVSDLSEAKRSTEPGASPRSMGSQPRVNPERGAGQQAASPQPLAVAQGEARVALEAAQAAVVACAAGVILGGIVYRKG